MVIIATVQPGKTKSKPPIIKVGSGHFILVHVNPFTKQITYYDGLLAMLPYDPQCGDEDVEKFTANVFRYVKVSTSNAYKLLALIHLVANENNL